MFGRFSAGCVVNGLSVSLQTEWEALELTDHQWALEDVEEELMAKDLRFEGLFKEELQTSMF